MSSPTVRFAEREPVEHEHIHIVERERERERERAPQRSPSPPPVVRGPTIERDVITHYTDVDHGMYFFEKGGFMSKVGSSANMNNECRRDTRETPKSSTTTKGP